MIKLHISFIQKTFLQKISIHYNLVTREYLGHFGIGILCIFEITYCLIIVAKRRFKLFIILTK